MFKKTPTKNFSNRRTAGFTLYEMLVSVAIISIVAGIAFFSHKQFKSDIEISNLAYKLALVIRQAQIDSVSVRQFTQSSGQQEFNAPFGVHFEISHPESFILFADADADGLFKPLDPDDTMTCDTSPGSECIEKVSISTGNSITGWCGFFWSTGTTNCSYVGVNDKQFLDISFKRPNPDARFRFFDSTYEDGSEVVEPCDDGSTNVACTGWAICLGTTEGHRKKVVVYDTGQISVENVVLGDPVCGA